MAAQIEEIKRKSVPDITETGWTYSISRNLAC
jgi:hypothetical protein